MPGPPNARRARAPLPSIWYCPPLWIQTDEVATAEGGKSAPGQLHHLEQRDTVRRKQARQSYLTRVIQLPHFSEHDESQLECYDHASCAYGAERQTHVTS